jgi:hypothetical protein
MEFLEEKDFYVAIYLFNFFPIYSYVHMNAYMLRPFLPAPTQLLPLLTHPLTSRQNMLLFRVKQLSLL